MKSSGSKGGYQSLPTGGGLHASDYEGCRAEAAQNAYPFLFRGTVFQLLAKDTKVYGLFAWMTLWLVLRAVGVVEGHEVPGVTRSYLAYFQFALTFVLAFFLNCTYKDFQDQGRGMFAALGPAHNTVLMVKAYFRHAPAFQERVVRLLNAAHYLTWMDLGAFHSYTDLVERGFLTRPEADALRGMAPGPRSGYAILWALEDVAEFMARQEEDAHAGKRGGPSVPEHIGILLGESLLHTRLAFSKLTVERSVTVPHMYTHMLWWFMMTFLTTLGFYAGIGKEDKDDVMGQVWWVVGYIMVTLAFCGLFDVAMALKEPFGTDSSDIDPLVAVDRAVALHQGFLSAPSMPADKQPSSMAAYDMFHASKSPGSSTWQPARGPLHTATWVPQVSCELHEMLSCRLPHDDDPFAASGSSMA